MEMVTCKRGSPISNKSVRLSCTQQVSVVLIVTCDTVIYYFIKRLKRSREVFLFVIFILFLLVMIIHFEETLAHLGTVGGCFVLVLPLIVFSGCTLRFEDPKDKFPRNTTQHKHNRTQRTQKSYFGGLIANQ